MSQSGGTDDLSPWGSYYFSLELDQTEVAHFMECSGLKSTSAVFEIEEGGQNAYTHKRAGGAKWENIVLKRALSASTLLEEWYDRYLQGDYSDRAGTSGAIVVRGNDGEELRRYTFLSAWPVSWEGPSLDGGSSDLAIESLEIAHDGILIDMDQPPLPPPEAGTLPEQIDSEPVQFESGSSELSPEGEAAVDDVAEQLNEHPEITTIWVEGHTDDEGSWSSNKQLSQDRADTVKARLEQQAPGKTYHADGYSYDHPVASNSTAEGRAKNRRTDFFQTPRSGPRSGELA